MRDDKESLADWLLDAPRVAHSLQSGPGGICEDLLGLEGAGNMPDLGKYLVLGTRVIFNTKSSSIMP